MLLSLTEKVKTNSMFQFHTTQLINPILHELKLFLVNMRRGGGGGASLITSTFHNLARPMFAHLLIFKCSFNLCKNFMQIYAN